MHATPYGRRVYATGGGREAAYLSGVAVRRVIASTYVWCGALAGVAGVMLAARLQSGQPTAGEFYELTAIAAVVLGGAALHGGEGTLYKSIIGVFIMIVLGNSLNLLNVDSYWQRVAVGAVIIAAAAADRLRSRPERVGWASEANPSSLTYDRSSSHAQPPPLRARRRLDRCRPRWRSLPHRRRRSRRSRSASRSPRTTIRSTSPCCAASAPAPRSSAGRWRRSRPTRTRSSRSTACRTWSRAASRAS